MGDLIDLKTRLASVFSDVPPSEFEVFLAEEGLELLSNFRSINDPSIRNAIKSLVAELAAVERKSSG